MQIAARQGTRRRVRPAGLDVEAPDDVGRLVLQATHPDPANSFGHDFVARQQQVVRQAQRRHSPATEPLFGHKMQTELAPHAGVQCRHVRVAQANRPGSRAAVFTRQGVQQLLLTVAGDAGDTHHFARSNLDRNIFQVHAKLVVTRQAQGLYTQHWCAGLLRAMRQLRRFGADHQARQRGIRLLRRVAHTGDLAAPQYGTGGAQRADLVQLVADVQDAATFGRQLPEHHEQLVHRLRCQHRGRFVEDQQLRAGQQGTDDFDALHLAHAQGVYRARRIDVQPVLLRLGADAAGNVLQRERFGKAEPDVLGHRDGVEQAEVLEHHADAHGPRLLRVADEHRLAVEHDAALIGLDRAVDDFHQGRFTGAVFAQHGMGFARHDSQRDIAVGDYGRITFGDAR